MKYTQFTSLSIITITNAAVGYGLLLGIGLHYIEVIMTTMASQITSLAVVCSTVYHTQIKENIKTPRHWPLCGEFTGTGEFPAQMVSNAENVAIWWRHHGNEIKSHCILVTLYSDKVVDQISGNGLLQRLVTGLLLDNSIENEIKPSSRHMAT